MNAVSEVHMLPNVKGVMGAALRREWLSHRLNRFLHAHIALVLVIGALPLLTAGDGFSRGAAWWLLHGVLYAVSLSTLLLGLSSAHAEVEEHVWIMGQPGGIGAWLTGKAAGLAMLSGGSTALIGGPVLAMGGASGELAVATSGAVGVAVVCALVGFALGFWVRDGVRGLIAAVGVWFAMLFGVDLLLLGVAGSPWVQAHPDAWIALLMANPLDAFRITVMFSVERAAFSGLGAGSLTNWWAANAGGWLGGLCLAWVAIGGVVAWLGLRRRSDDL